MQSIISKSHIPSKHKNPCWQSAGVCSEQDVLHLPVLSQAKPAVQSFDCVDMVHSGVGIIGGGDGEGRVEPKRLDADAGIVLASGGVVGVETHSPVALLHISFSAQFKSSVHPNGVSQMPSLHISPCAQAGTHSVGDRGTGTHTLFSQVSVSLHAGTHSIGDRVIEDTHILFSQVSVSLHAGTHSVGDREIGTHTLFSQVSVSSQAGVHSIDCVTTSSTHTLFSQCCPSIHSGVQPVRVCPCVPSVPSFGAFSAHILFSQCSFTPQSSSAWHTSPTAFPKKSWFNVLNKKTELTSIRIIVRYIAICNGFVSWISFGIYSPLFLISLI